MTAWIPFAAYQGPTGGNDVNTKLLLHFNGADTSTTFTDSSGVAQAFTANGNAQIDTAASKFGGASGLFDGTGDWIDTPDHAEFTIGTSAMTVDCWVNITATGQLGIAGQIDSGGSGASTSFLLYKSAAEKTVFVVHADSTDVTITGTTSINTGAWVHLAGVITGTTMKLFVNGTQEGGDQTLGGAVNDSSNKFAVGRCGEYTGIAAWNGWIDEFRLSVGIARWTANFTPPVAAYS